MDAADEDVCVPGEEGGAFDQVWHWWLSACSGTEKRLDPEAPK